MNHMARFESEYPAGYLDGFLAGFASGLPGATRADWLYLGRVLDLFALSDLVTRPAGHLIADQAAGVVRSWIATGVPR